MLVLKRKLGESVVIIFGDVRCEVILHRVRPGEASLVFKPDDEVLVLRSEIDDGKPAKSRRAV